MSWNTPTIRYPTLQEIEEGFSLQSVVMFGAMHHLELLRVTVRQNLDGAFLQEPYVYTRDNIERFDAMQQVHAGAYETMKLGGGTPGEWVCFMFPYAN